MRKELVVLVLAVTVSALLVIDLRHRNRQLFAELQTLTRERDALNTEWGQLLLEQGAWSEHRRIESIARSQLAMALPSADQTVVVGARPGAR
jgi:cell division protein FtsL